MGWNRLDFLSATGNGREGEVLELGPTRFVHVTHPDIFQCTVAEHADATEPLNAVKVVHSGAENIFVAGQCGVLFDRTAGEWTKRRSSRSAHVSWHFSEFEVRGSDSYGLAVAASWHLEQAKHLPLDRRQLGDHRQRIASLCLQFVTLDVLV